MALNGPIAIAQGIGPAALPGATWLMFSDFSQPLSAAANGALASSLRKKGSLVLEYTPHGGLAPLLHLPSTTASLPETLITQEGQAGISLRIDSRSRNRIIRLSQMQDAVPGPCRLAWSWDLARERGWLSLEHLRGGRLKQVEFTQRTTPDLSALPRLLSRAPSPVHFPAIASQVGFIGLSRAVEPVGLVASIGAGTPIETPHGFRPIEDLRPGECVLAGGGETLPVRAVLEREVPCAGHFAPLRLRAPFFGLRQSITLAPEQRILLAGSEIEYLFGHEKVLCELGQLRKLRITLPENRSKTIRMYQLLLDRPVILNAAGCRIESLDIGRIRNAPGLAATSILSGIPLDELPLHAKPSCPVLAPHEARAIGANGCSIRNPALCPSADTRCLK